MPLQMKKGKKRSLKGKRGRPSNGKKLTRSISVKKSGSNNSSKRQSTSIRKKGKSNSDKTQILHSDLSDEVEDCNENRTKKSKVGQRQANGGINAVLTSNVFYTVKYSLPNLNSLKLISLEGPDSIRKFVYYESPITKLIDKNKLLLANIKNFSLESKIGTTVNEEIRNNKNTGGKHLKTDAEENNNFDDMNSDTIENQSKKRNFNKFISKDERTMNLRHKTIKKLFSPKNPCVLIPKTQNFAKNLRSEILDSSNLSLSDVINTSTESCNDDMLLDNSSPDKKLQTSNNDSLKGAALKSDKENCTTIEKGCGNGKKGRKLNAKVINNDIKNLNKINDAKINAAQIPISPKEFDSLFKRPTEQLNANLEANGLCSLKDIKGSTEEAVYDLNRPEKSAGMCLKNSFDKNLKGIKKVDEISANNGDSENENEVITPHTNKDTRKNLQKSYRKLNRKCKSSKKEILCDTHKVVNHISTKKGFKLNENCSNAEDQEKNNYKKVSDASKSDSVDEHKNENIESSMTKKGVNFDKTVDNKNNALDIEIKTPIRFSKRKRFLSPFEPYLTNFNQDKSLSPFSKQKSLESKTKKSDFFEKLSNKYSPIKVTENNNNIENLNVLKSHMKKLEKNNKYEEKNEVQSLLLENSNSLLLLQTDKEKLNEESHKIDEIDIKIAFNLSNDECSENCVSEKILEVNNENVENVERSPEEISTSDSDKSLKMNKNISDCESTFKTENISFKKSDKSDKSDEKINHGVVDSISVEEKGCIEEKDNTLMRIDLKTPDDIFNENIVLEVQESCNVPKDVLNKAGMENHNLEKDKSLMCQNNSAKTGNLLETNVEHSDRENNLSEKSDSAGSVVIKNEENENSFLKEEMDLPLSAGEIYWARVASFPYWPCIIWPDNEGQIIIAGNNQRGKEQVKVHVRFFADNGRRSWALKNNILPYYGREEFVKLCEENIQKYAKKHHKFFMIPKKPLWEQAINEADELILQPLENRCEEFEKIVEQHRSLLTKRRKECLSSVLTLSYTQNSEYLDDKIWQRQLSSTPTLGNPENIENDCPELKLKQIMKRIRSPTPDSPAYENIDDLKMFVKQSKLGKLMNNNCVGSSMVETVTGMTSLETPRIIRETESLHEGSKENKIGEENKNGINETSSASLPVNIFDDKEFSHFYEFLKTFILCGTSNSINNSIEDEFSLLVQELWVLRSISRKSESHIESIFTSNSKSKRLLSKRMKKLSQQVLGPIPDNSSTVKPKKRTVKRIINRPIDEVINDILELPRNYLFRNLNREPVCQVCEKPSKLVKCSGNCQSWFHRSCIADKKQKNNDNSDNNNRGENKESNTNHAALVHITSDLNNTEFISSKSQVQTAIIEGNEKILCSECESGSIPACFVCHKNDPELGDRIRCSINHCGKHFHIKCFKYWPQVKLTRSSAKIERLFCPSHVCHTCVSDDPRGKFLQISKMNLVKCIKCPATYHLDSVCIPAGAQFITATQIICPRHYQKSTSKGVKLNASWCFICTKGGSLICCETCPTAFHIECLKISQPEENYICEECETGRLPLYSELVWAKLSHFRWWPAIIIPPPEIPLNIQRKNHKPNEFCVRFFGSNDHAYISRDKVFLYQEGDWGSVNSKSAIDQTYKFGLEEARRIFSLLKSKRLELAMDENKEKDLTPPPYIKIKTNRPVPPVTLKELETSELTPCNCDRNEENPCSLNSTCINRMLFTECNPKLCPAGDKCQNQMFEKRLYPNLRVVKTEGKGWGLKCSDPISAGTFIIEYVGEIIDDAEFQRRIAQKQEERDENYYFLTLEKDYMIDAGLKGNLARFINHSCEPNCITQKWTVNGITRVGLFAIKDIPADTELTFHYNLTCIGDDKKICHCGAEKCTGYIGTKYREAQVERKTMAHEKSTKKRKLNKNSDKEKPKAKRIKKATKSQTETESFSAGINSSVKDNVNFLK